MPKLAAKDRKKVAAAEATGDFPLIPPGKYIGELAEVEARDSSNGNPMWVAVFTNIVGADGTEYPGRQWYQMMLPTTDEPPEGYEPKGREKDPQKAWAVYQGLCAARIKGFFEAFGFTEDSDTDEMVGERCVLQIGVRTIQGGPRVGEEGNSLNNVFPLDSVDWADSAGKAGGDPDGF